MFQRLFGDLFDPRRRCSPRSPETAERKSVLDFVAEDAGPLRDRLGAADRRSSTSTSTACARWNGEFNRRSLREIEPPSMVRPTGVPQDFREHARLLADLIVLAFQADLTRVGDLRPGQRREQPQLSEIGVPDGHHDVSHHGGDPGNAPRCSRSTYCMLGSSLPAGTLGDAKEADGSLLDHCMIMYGSWH